jgi:16S rRNA (guanine966-N2)-methyltransferase
MIRIASGRFRGRPLPVTDRKEKSLRPTSIKCRAALVNILNHTFRIDWPNAHVLDLFAGTGALGFEALSQGCPLVVFLEGHALTAKTLAHTCRTLGVASSTHVIHWSIPQDLHGRGAYLPKILTARDTPFSLIFCDPPYAMGFLASHALTLLQDAHLIAPHALLVLETGADEPDPSLPPGFNFCLSRVYGDTRVLFVQADIL